MELDEEFIHFACQVIAIVIVLSAALLLVLA